MSFKIHFSCELPAPSVFPDLNWIYFIYIKNKQLQNSNTQTSNLDYIFPLKISKKELLWYCHKMNRKKSLFFDVKQFSLYYSTSQRLEKLVKILPSFPHKAILISYQGGRITGFFIIECQNTMHNTSFSFWRK